MAGANDDPTGWRGAIMSMRVLASQRSKYRLRVKVTQLVATGHLSVDEANTIHNLLSGDAADTTPSELRLLKHDLVAARNAALITDLQVNVIFALIPELAAA